jgi:uncharacterized protein (TIGR02001 family)
MNISKSLVSGALIAGAAAAAPAQAAELSANISAANNYIWRGLTQTTNDAAVQGGLDFALDNGLYAGTWTSNVKYGPDDAYSYENDYYAGWSGSKGDWTFDVGYLYYNYDNDADFDFGEVYGTIGFRNLSFSAYGLANTEADEGPGQDFDAFKTYYLSLDYGFEILDGIEIGLHGGYHTGDFQEAFNGTTGSYYDYNVSLSKGGFGFMISDTDVDGPAAEGGLDNDEVKFVVSYSVDFDLWSN